MSMNYNFRFKKYLKYFFLGVLCYLLFKGINVNALSYNNGNLNINTAPFDNTADMLSSGGETELTNTINTINSSSNIEEYITDLHQSVYITTGYNSFEDFANDNYYSIVYYYYNNHIENTYVYYTNKVNGEFGFNLSSSSQSTQNLAYNTEVAFNFAPTMYSSDFAGGSLNKLTYVGFYFSSGYGGSLTAPTLGWGPVFTAYCRNQYTTNCITSWDGNSSTLTAPIGNWLSVTNRKFFYDTNVSSLDLYLDSYTYRYTSSTDTNRYFNTYYFNSDFDSPYILTDFITNLWFGDIVSIEGPNIQDLGNNSYGINFNTIDNIYFDFTNDLSTTIRCPDNRGLIGNVCYLYSSDIQDFDIYNTNASNSVAWYLGSGSNLVLDSSKYYVITFRLYTPYNVDVLTTIYNFTNSTTNYPFNIVDKYYQDYSLYKDYSIVFQPTHSGTGNLDYINIVFNTFDNFTNVLEENYSFGVFKSVKLSQYDNQPTLTDVQNEISNNSLDSISNLGVDNFFTDFNINDRGLSQIILLPLNFISSFANQSCTSISLPIPHINNATLPCVSSFMESNFSVLWSLYKLLFNGILIYKVLISLFADLKNLYRPDNDRIEVLDL